MYNELKKIGLTIVNHEMWLYLAWNDIKARYRRTIIGPLWLVLANAITIIGMAVIWSIIFKMDIKEYFPILTGSMVCWSLISSTIVESGTTFSQNANLIQNIPMSIYLPSLRLLSRNIMTFAHNFIIFVFVALFCGVKINSYTLLFFPFLFVILMNFFFLSFTLGLIGVRYRDFPQFLTAFMSVLIFITPVMWEPSMLGSRSFIAYLNPFTHVLLVMRKPLLGQLPEMISIGCVIGMTIINFIFMMVMAKKYSTRIPYWV
jgi:homopolymeric O-antigen transport system permease protein